MTLHGFSQNFLHYFSQKTHFPLVNFSNLAYTLGTFLHKRGTYLWN